MPPLNIVAEGLFIPLRTTFKQASSVRNTAESVWVEARRDILTGYGEGCPRSYVTGEKVAECLSWLEPRLAEIERQCTSLKKLKGWVSSNRKLIDQHPAAWCSVELALLDLFAREEGRSVEELLGLNDPRQASYVYSAVLSDGSEEKYRAMTDRYLSTGFKDFKVKIGGDIATDKKKLELLKAQCETAGVYDPRIRLDANNLWAEKSLKAIRYLSELGNDFFAVEEPVEPCNPKALSQISQSLDKAIILDESLLKLADLASYQRLKGRFIANIKVSRVGGILRALELVGMLKKKNWPIIVGAHVGETSVLTRASMLVAADAGSSLLAQEGGYGTMLLEADPVMPSLQFGYGGLLELPSMKGGEWRMGWGLSPDPKFKRAYIQ